MLSFLEDYLRRKAWLKEICMAGNFVYLEGTLVRYETRKVGKKETRVANLTLACYNGGQSDGPGYYDVEFWRPRPEQSKAFKEAAASQNKKARVAISGFLKVDSWEDDKGNKRTKVKIVANSLNLIFDQPEREEGDNRGGGYGGRSNFKKGGGFKKRPPQDDDEADENEGADDGDDEDEAPPKKQFKKQQRDENDEDSEAEERPSSKKSRKSSDDDEDVPF